MSKSIVYFDIDGTIYDFQNGILEDTKKAICQILEKGNYVCLCSGRSRARIYNDVFLNFGIQGVIAAGGAYVEWQGEVIENHLVTPEAADYAVDILRENYFVPVMEGPRYLYYDDNEYTTEIDYYQNLIEKKMGKNRLSITGNRGTMEVNKISAKKTKGSQAEKAIQELAPWFRAIVHKGITIEFIPHGYSKGIAAKKLASRLDISFEDTYGFGDSMNDIELFNHVSHGIAMGGGVHQLKEAAEMVTKHRLDGGIRYALNHYGLLG